MNLSNSLMTESELHFCTPLSSSMMQAGVCLRQDTETTLPELTEQNRIRQKEEELSGLESVYMAETECAAPGLNTLEPEYVSVHSGVSDVHHAQSSLIKTETHLGFPHTGVVIKTESLDSAELRCLSRGHSDQIKTESVDGGYVKVEHINELQDIQYVHIKSDQIKYESSECLVSDDVMNTVMHGGAIGEQNQNCKNEEIHHLLTQCGGLDHNRDINNENTQPRIVLQKSTNSRERYIDCLETNVTTEPMIINSNKDPSLLTFFQKETIHRNKSEISTGEKRYGCTHCGKCFSRKCHLNVHIMTHTGEKPYKCIECDKHFTFTSNLKNHMRIHRGEKTYECIQCDKRFNVKAYLNTHMRTHTGEKPYRCIHCWKCFTQKGTLTRHQRIHTAPMIPNSSKNQSLLNFCQNNTIQQNRSEMYTGEKPYKCTQCEKCFRRKHVLKCHKRIHTGEKPYKCPECGKCFSLRSAFNSHKVIHSSKKPYQCTQCTMSFLSNSDVNRHMRIHTGERPYACIQCDKCFYTKTDLDRHVRIHTGEKPFECKECGKCFSRSCTLSDHILIHTGEKPYKCTECGKCFSRNGALSDHMMTHSGEKPYICPRCGKCFSHRSSFNSHKIIHSVEKTYN